MPKIYLARHAEAESGEQMDPTRGLTETGKAQIKVMADFLATQTDRIAAVLCSSDLQRGRDTGEGIAKRLDVPVAYTPFVDPDVTPEKAWATIKAAAKKLEDGQELLVISHGPTVNALAALLLDSGEGDKFHFSHGSIMHLDTDDPDPATGYPLEGRGENLAYLHWFASAKMMNRAMEQDETAVIEAALSVADAVLKSLGCQMDEAGDYYMDDVTVKKWVLGDGGKSGSCEDCEGNADQGEIEESEVFDSGHVEPPAHPSCDCSVEYRDTTQRVYV